MKYESENLKRLTVTSSGTSVVQSAAGRAMQNRKSAADSTLNSLECWDYNVELECEALVVLGIDNITVRI